MLDDGAIRIRYVLMRGEDTGEGLVILRPDDPRYPHILEELGEMKPGETKTFGPVSGATFWGSGR